MNVKTTTSTSFVSTTLTTVTTTTMTTTSKPVCGSPIPPPSSGLAVMLMPTNSAGLLCLYYPGMNFTQQSEFYSGIHSIGHLDSIKDPHNVIPAEGVNITILSDSATPANETIEYSIQTSGNSTGVYSWWVGGECPGFPLVVGMNLTSARSTLNGYYSGAFYCPEEFYGAQLSGLSGITLQYLS